MTAGMPALLMLTCCRRWVLLQEAPCTLQRVGCCVTCSQ